MQQINYQQVVQLLISSATIIHYHSMASSNPSPLRADVLNMDQVLFLSADNPNELDISAGVMAPSRSCLFANTIKIAFLSSSSYKSKHKDVYTLYTTLHSATTFVHT